MKRPNVEYEEIPTWFVDAVGPDGQSLRIGLVMAYDADAASRIVLMHNEFPYLGTWEIVCSKVPEIVQFHRW